MFSRDFSLIPHLLLAQLSAFIRLCDTDIMELTLLNYQCIYLSLLLECKQL